MKDMENKRLSRAMQETTRTAEEPGEPVESLEATKRAKRAKGNRDAVKVRLRWGK